MYNICKHKLTKCYAILKLALKIRTEEVAPVSMTLEADVSDMALEVGPSHQYSIVLLSCDR